ncbi:hypothetical protein Tco_1175955 [Tanacetum coccineum]|uniref:Retrotransposon protein, putative, Ty1-copia subclass n=1 Tax=Tanacetum coccineum TaxID=301880 RepID=A0ABQ5GNY3_9ASTR
MQQRLCLNMEVEDDEVGVYGEPISDVIGLNQSAYIDKILKKFNMQNSKKGFIPMEVKHDLSNEMCASSDEEKAYMKRNPWGSSTGCCLNIYPLKYLRNIEKEYVFSLWTENPEYKNLMLRSSCDASWQCDKDDTKSQTGYVFVVNGGAVDWKSKKLTTFASMRHNQMTWLRQKLHWKQF